MSTNARTVIMDFDDTLFETYRLKQALADSARRFGFSTEEFWYSYKQTRDEAPGRLTYTLDRHAHTLCQMHPELIEENKLAAAFDEAFNARNFVCADAPPLLDFLKSRGNELILLSLGESAFQRRKVEASGLGHFFNRVEFTDTKKLDVIPHLVRADAPVYFINDKTYETKEIVRAYPHWQALLKIRTDLSPVQYEESGLPCFHTLADMHTYFLTSW